jgi:hypothetical protein
MREPNRGSTPLQNDAVNDRIRPCVLILQSEPALVLAASIAQQGYEVVGPFDSLSEAFNWLDKDTPTAAILDLTLRDGGCSDLAYELHKRGVPFLFYSYWESPKQIPVELRDEIFMERLDRSDLIPGLLARMVQETGRAG